MTTFPFNNRPGKYPFSVAPMMDWTDRHFRFFMRLISKRALLYTEMIPVGAIVRSDPARFISYSPEEHPLVLQVGGDNPESLAECSRIAADFGYDEINLNCGCPSEKVRSGRFGACLMEDPSHVARCMEKMREGGIPVSIKHRISLGGIDSYEYLRKFVTTVKEGGCEKFIVHARSAILGGLSAKENRTIPPLRYDYVYRLKEEFPDLIIEINGGIRTMEEIIIHLSRTDGVMVGRAAYENPFEFSAADNLFSPAEARRETVFSRVEIVEQMIPYIEEVLRNGGRMHSVTRHMFGLFSGLPGASHYRRTLSTEASRIASPRVLFERAMERIGETAAV